MAESVKRRVAAARLAVAFVAAGTIAGATAWAQADPPPTAQSSASDIFAKIGDIKGSQIEDHSLRYVDFAKGQVPSFKLFDKLSTSFEKFKKADKSFKAQVKGELGDIRGELPSYLKTSEADTRYIKMNDAIMGDGSVFTATQALDKGAGPATLADISGLVKVEATNSQFTVTNTSGGPLTHTACAVGATGGSLAPGASLSCATSGEQAQTVQLVNGDGHVVTLNFSNVAIPSGTQATVQILIGL
jgi:hypothetical protein